MEKDIGTLEKVRGHTFDTIYDLHFTTERMIVLIIQHPLDLPYNPGITDLFLGARSGKKREMPERMKIAEDRRRLHREKNFDDLIANHRFNFEIPYEKVESVEIKRGLFHSRLKLSISGPSNSVKKIKFTLARKQTADAKRLLDHVLPLKINS